MNGFNHSNIMNRGESAVFIPEIKLILTNENSLFPGDQYENRIVFMFKLVPYKTHIYHSIC